MRVIIGFEDIKSNEQDMIVSYDAHFDENSCKCSWSAIVWTTVLECKQIMGDKADNDPAVPASWIAMGD